MGMSAFQGFNADVMHINAIVIQCHNYDVITSVNHSIYLWNKCIQQKLRGTHVRTYTVVPHACSYFYKETGMGVARVTGDDSTEAPGVGSKSLVCFASLKTKCTFVERLQMLCDTMELHCERLSAIGLILCT